jgi:hypothetical protein
VMASGPPAEPASCVRCSVARSRTCRGKQEAQRDRDALACVQQVQMASGPPAEPASCVRCSVARSRSYAAKASGNAVNAPVRV